MLFQPVRHWTPSGHAQARDYLLDPRARSRPIKPRLPFVAAAVLSGGNVRVGLEDNLWLERGRLASNAELVEKAAGIVRAMGVEIMTPAEVRAELNLVKRAPL